MAAGKPRGRRSISLSTRRRLLLRLREAGQIYLSRKMHQEKPQASRCYALKSGMNAPPTLSRAFRKCKVRWAADNSWGVIPDIFLFLESYAETIAPKAAGELMFIRNLEFMRPECF